MAGVPSSLSGPQFTFKRTEEETSLTSPTPELVVTLLIKHLPEAIPQETLLRLFSHYGAFSVRPCSSGRLRNCAFVDFKNEALAYQAQHQFNGLRFLGKVLSVERASRLTDGNKVKQDENQLAKDFGSVKNDNMTKDHIEGLRSRPLPIGEPIAAKLGVDYPFPPHLEYAYPPPDGNILTNILNALIAVPRFYTQVLHLMNKMNIPAPFRMALPSPPFPPSIPASTLPLGQPSLPPPVASKPLVPDLSSGESEMESTDEEEDGKAISSGPMVVAKQPKKKRFKHEAIVGPAIDKDVAHEAVGVKPATLVPKEIPMLKKNNPVLQIKIASKMNLNGQKDDNYGKDLVHLEKEDSNLKSFATPEEIECAKLPPEEILSLPMFKNYTAGNPTSVLYVKNLAKDVVPDDFYYIFGSLFGSIDIAKSSLVVKLMQEGRMRGQSFVTFPSVELACSALNLVNGYMFKGKPMIIQFGRNPAAAKAN